MSNAESKDQVTVQAASTATDAVEVNSQSSLPKDPSVAIVKSPTTEDASAEPADQIDGQKQGFLAFFKTKEFYIILALG